MKNAIVTGGTKGIGKSIACALLQRGYHVVVTYASDEEAAGRATKDFSQCGGGSFEVVKVNQADKAAVHAFTATLNERLASVDVMVCNAGATVRKDANEITDEEWEQAMMIGLNSHYYMIRDLWSRIPNDSRIIFIGSMMAVHPHGTSLVYGVMKSAVHALAKNLVKAFAGTGTTVNVIAPGFVDTEWQKEKPQEIRERICAKTAAHRFASPDEISGTVLYLLDNAFVNGAVLEVSGGYCFA